MSPSMAPSFGVSVMFKRWMKLRVCYIEWMTAV
uniref:Uncharacterized protein n=1 Tax=Arundo donax TaxID=35708 RepID=A0A0A9M094_ARUDO